MLFSLTRACGDRFETVFVWIGLEACVQCLCASVSAWLRGCVHACVPLSVRPSVHVWVCGCARVCGCACVRACVVVSVCVCVSVSVSVRERVLLCLRAFDIDCKHTFK